MNRGTGDTRGLGPGGKRSAPRGEAEQSPVGPGRPGPGTGRTPWLTAKESAALAGLLLWPAKTRASAVYDLLADHNNLAEQSLYLNLGYWAEADGYDAACEALAVELGRVAGLGPGQTVVDAGFGFGDQDACWRRRFGPERIIGLNVTRGQVERARARFPDPGLDFRLGSATAMPLDDASADRVLGLESAFHFDTRVDFFAEALRVLRPGGRLALADVVPVGPPRGLGHRIGLYVGRSFWQIPAANMVPPDAYAAQLQAAGFTNVEVRSIGDQVFAPFKAFAQRRVLDPEIRARVHPFLRAAWAAPHRGFRSFDYVLVTADKP
jgi:ubiquinone/menaquinone biosynthesis C-methylase UbiE